MMSKATRKLTLKKELLRTLNKELLRTLNEEHLRVVNGGDDPPSWFSFDPFQCQTIEL